IWSCSKRCAFLDRPMLVSCPLFEIFCQKSCLYQVQLSSCAFSQLAGGVVMAVGVWTLVEKSDYISLLPSKTYATSAYILVLAGAIVMVTGVLGCCATFKEQRKLLQVVRDHTRVER
ncbi:hypothetical protein GOODEAATRI_011674, partial [Goodea atripinnis]